MTDPDDAYRPDLARVTTHYRTLADTKRGALVDIWRGPTW